jgi:small subunit ribosomal protein S6
MPLYETVFIARQDLTADDVDALAAKLSKIITDGKGKIVSKEYWGLRNLSYKVKKNSRGERQNLRQEIRILMTDTRSNTEKLRELRQRKNTLEREIRDFQHRLANSSRTMKNLAVSGWQEGEMESLKWVIQTGKETMKRMDAEIATVKAEIAVLERGKTAGKKFGF